MSCKYIPCLYKKALIEQDVINHFFLLPKHTRTYKLKKLKKMTLMEAYGPGPEQTGQLCQLSRGGG